jgi:hypothetical protein
MFQAWYPTVRAHHSTNPACDVILCCDPVICFLLLQVRSYIIDGANSTGVHAIDLTLEELKRVRVRQRLYTRSQAFDDFLPVMTFEECATMARVRNGDIAAGPGCQSSQIALAGSTKPTTAIASYAANMAVHHAVQHCIPSRCTIAKHQPTLDVAHGVCCLLLLLLLLLLLPNRTSTPARALWLASTQRPSTPPVSASQRLPSDY